MVMTVISVRPNMSSMWREENAAGGCGIYWGDSHPWNSSVRLELVDSPTAKPTNNQAEMMAAILAIDQANKEE